MSNLSNIAIIVPSRNRPESIVELQKALKETNTKAKLFVVVDLDDPKFDKYRKLEKFGSDSVRILGVQNDTRGMAKPLNVAASYLLGRANNFETFIFLGDDHRPRTNGWDEIWHNTEADIVYGDDLFQGKNLPTAVGMSRRVVEALGGMTPPGLQHLYLDNFWLRLGKDLDSIQYIPETVVEHLHPAAGKGNWDQGYLDVNAPEVYHADNQAFTNYILGKEYRELLDKLL